MAKRLVTFGRNLGLSLRDIARDHRYYRARTQFKEPRQNSAYVAIALTPVGGIPARSGLVFSSAECTFAFLNQDDELEDFNENGLEAVWNPYYFDLPGEIYIDVNREVFSGRLLASVKGGFAAKVVQEITARAGTTAGSGSVELQQLDPATGALTTLGVEATAYNTSQHVGAVDKYIQVKIEFSGLLLWDVDDCA